MHHPLEVARGRISVVLMLFLSDKQNSIQNVCHISVSWFVNGSILGKMNPKKNHLKHQKQVIEGSDFTTVSRLFFFFF